jgi:hypothetical protein
MGIVNSDIVWKNPASLASVLSSLTEFSRKDQPMRFAEPFMRFADETFLVVPCSRNVAVADRFDISCAGKEKKYMASGNDFWLWDEVPSKMPLIDVVFPPFW